MKPSVRWRCCGSASSRSRVHRIVDWVWRAGTPPQMQQTPRIAAACCCKICCKTAKKPGVAGALWRSVGQDSELNGPRWRTLAHAKVAFRPASKRLLAQTSLAEQTPTRSGADWPPATCRSSLLRWGPRRATSWTVSETSPRRPRRLAAAVNLLLGNSWKFPCAGSTGERAFSRRQSYVAFRSS